MAEQPVLAFSDEGKGPCVVIVHGLFGSQANFVSLARVLAARYRVLRVDLPNHGRSWHGPDQTLESMAAAVLGVLDHCGVEQAWVIGHSLGGKVAMAMAQQAAQRVLGLVVADILPIASAAGGHDSLFAALQKLPLAALNSRGEADKQLAASIADAGLRQFLLTNLQRQQQGFAWRIGLDYLQQSYNQLMAAPQWVAAWPGPVLFIMGERSEYFEQRRWPVVQQYFPAAELTVMAGAGHWLHAEQPQRFQQLVADFLGRKLAGIAAAG